MTTALRDVRVFDGRGLSDPCTVVIDGAVIGADPTGADQVDAAGGVLLPGLIDAHIHPDGPAALAALAAHGVTTGLTMATWPAELVASMRNRPGLTDIRSAGLPAIGPNGPHARMPGLAALAVVRDPAHARRFVTRAIRRVWLAGISTTAETHRGDEEEDAAEQGVTGQVAE